MHAVAAGETGISPSGILSFTVTVMSDVDYLLMLTVGAPAGLRTHHLKVSILHFHRVVDIDGATLRR